MKFSSELEEFVPSTAPLTGPFYEKFEEKIQGLSLEKGTSACSLFILLRLLY